MTPEDCVRGIAGAVGKLGGAFMFDGQAFERGKQLGLDPWPWYHVGRGGVLGDVDPSVVVAAFGYFYPPLQTKAWTKGVAVCPPREVTRAYADACADYGRRSFAVPEAGRLADLLGTALRSAHVAGLPLFAGWRAIADSYDEAQVDDGPGRLALWLQTAREHRGGAHLVAVLAEGVPPLNALVSGRNGPANAQFFGWPEPWPDPAEYAEAMQAAEARTDALVAPAYAALTDDERAELTAGLRALKQSAQSAGHTLAP